MKEVKQIFSRCLFIVSALQDQQVLATLVCVCVCACSHVGSYNLKSTPTIARRGRTRPGRKKKKAQKLRFLHQPELAGCVVWCLLDHRRDSPPTPPAPPPPYPPAFPPFFFPPTSANFPCSRCSVTQNECQSFHPAVGSKQPPPTSRDKTAAVCRHNRHKTMTDVSMWLGAALPPWRQPASLTWDQSVSIFRTLTYLSGIKPASPHYLFSYFHFLLLAFAAFKFLLWGAEGAGELKHMKHSVCAFLWNVGWTSDHPDQVPSGISQPGPCQRL